MEEWRSINFNPNYEVSNKGRVKSLVGPYGRFREKILKFHVNKYGYKRVCLFPEVKQYSVHFLVLNAFVGPRPEGYQSNHIDCDTGNNSVENLEWCTCRENALHALKFGTRTGPRGEISRWSKLKNVETLIIKQWLRCNVKQSLIANVFGVKQSAISRIKSGKRWAWI